MEKLFKFLFALDWWVAGGTLAYGAYAQDGWIIGAGMLGVGLAWYKPAQKIKALLEKKLLAKKKVKDESEVLKAEEAFYAAALPATAPVQAPRTYKASSLVYGLTYLSGNKHNQLKNPEHLQLTTNHSNYC